MQSIYIGQNPTTKSQRDVNDSADDSIAMRIKQTIYLKSIYIKYAATCLTNYYTNSFIRMINICIISRLTAVQTLHKIQKYAVTSKSIHSYIYFK